MVGALDCDGAGDWIDIGHHREQVWDVVETLRTVSDGSRKTIHRFHHHSLEGVDFEGRETLALPHSNVGHA